MSPDAQRPEAPAGSGGRVLAERAVLAAGLAALLAANLYLRHVLEGASGRMYSFLEAFYAPQIPILFGERPWWRLLLPLPELTGAWAATTLLLTYLVERVLAPGGAWYLFNALAIVVSFWTSWALFRSAVFSFTFAICVGFGTHYYHAYAVTGGIASYLLISYNLLLLFTVAQVVRGVRPAWAWRLALAGSVLVNALGYEGWLDVLVVVWLASPFVFLGLRRLERPAEAGRLVGVTAVLTAAGVAYVAIKVTMGYGQTAGAESDVLFNYRSLWLVADDLVANVFTHAYLSLSNFLPPALVGASAFYRLGADAVVAEQHGYHEPFAYLVVMNQVFLWRFHAGAALAIVLYAFWRTAVSMWRRPTVWTMVVGVALLMVVASGATHTLIKFRPMKAMPVMTYHVTVGVIGASLLIAWLATSAWQRWRRRAAAGALVAAIWVTIFYGALARPAYLAHMSAQVGLGEYLYPNPMRALVEKLGGTYEPPRGLALYRLAPYRADDAMAAARAMLADLPHQLPAPAEWFSPGEAAIGPAEGGGVDVAGDATQYGYQLMSPRIAVAPSTEYLVRLRFDVREGRVCGGVLAGDQQRWLVPPDGTTVEYRFDSGPHDAVYIVLANCNPTDLGNARSRFRLLGGSYAALEGPTP